MENHLSADAYIFWWK